MARPRNQCPRRSRSAHSLPRLLKLNVHQMRKLRGLKMMARPGATKMGLIRSLRRKMIQAPSCQRASPMSIPKRKRKKTAKTRKNSRNKIFLRHRLPSLPFTLLSNLRPPASQSLPSPSPCHALRRQHRNQMPPGFACSHRRHPSLTARHLRVCRREAPHRPGHRLWKSQ